MAGEDNDCDNSIVANPQHIHVTVFGLKTCVQYIQFSGRSCIPEFNHLDYVEARVETLFVVLAVRL